MNKQTSIKVQKILEDIYLIDSSLKKEEEKIKSLIEEMIENEPEIKLNQEFVNRLKEKVFTEIENLEKKDEKKVFFWQKLSYVSAGAAIVILLAVFLFPNFILNDFKKDSSQKISVLEERAFGSLDIDLRQSDSGEMEAEIADDSTSVLGLGETAEDMPSQVDDISIMPHPIVEQKNYHYVYEGEKLEEINLDDISNLVYSRVSDNRLANQGARVLSSFSGLPISLDNFSQKELKHFNMVEEKPYGYSLSVNLGNNTISVYSNWQNWPQPYKDCYDRECLDSLKLDRADMLSEGQLISIANEFIANYNVDLKNHSQALISEQTLERINNPENNPDHSYPEQAQIVYPLIIDDKVVVDNNGNPEGIKVGINIREEMVSSLVYNINSSNLVSSPYKLIDNLDEINPLLKRGGINPHFYRQSENNSIEVKLSDPEIALVRTWLPSLDKQSSSEIFLPALVFPISEKPDQYFNRQNIVIPLIEEVFRNSLKKIEERTGNDVEILPMPRIAPDQEPENAREIQKDDVYRIMPIE